MEETLTVRYAMDSYSYIAHVLSSCKTSDLFVCDVDLSGLFGVEINVTWSRGRVKFGKVTSQLSQLSHSTGPAVSDSPTLLYSPGSPRIPVPDTDSG